MPNIPEIYRVDNENMNRLDGNVQRHMFHRWKTEYHLRRIYGYKITDGNFNHLIPMISNESIYVNDTICIIWYKIDDTFCN